MEYRSLNTESNVKYFATVVTILRQVHSTGHSIRNAPCCDVVLPSYAVCRMIPLLGILFSYFGP